MEQDKSAIKTMNFISPAELQKSRDLVFTKFFSNHLVMGINERTKNFLSLHCEIFFYVLVKISGELFLKLLV